MPLPSFDPGAISPKSYDDRQFLDDMTLLDPHWPGNAIGPGELDVTKPIPEDVPSPFSY